MDFPCKIVKKRRNDRELSPCFVISFLAVATYFSRSHFSELLCVITLDPAQTGVV
jgi:hypothetical protein